MLSRRALLKRGALLVAAAYGIGARPEVVEAVGAELPGGPLRAEVGSLVEAAFPPGYAMAHWDGKGTRILIKADDGWLPADGSRFSPRRHPKLYDVVQEHYGGSRWRPRLPDLRAHVPTFR